MKSVLATRASWLCLFLLAASVWSWQIRRPLDLPSWHEFDYGSIARNFVREGNNILYPRIDWRGTGPGFTEMEFPIHPWMMAQLYRIFGIQIVWGRLIALGATLLSFLVFARLSASLLTPQGAWAATLFFAVNRITVYVASSVQPEALMLLFYLLAVYFFLRWYDHGGTGNFLATTGAFAAAMLIKLPAAHLGVFFALWALYRDGWKALRRPALWGLAVLSVVPAALWYSHARSLWATYHNSMGVSNEDHWIGLDLFRHPGVFVDLAGVELLYVFGLGGLLLACLGWYGSRPGQDKSRAAWFWAAAVALYYLVILRTAGAYWAWYYHIVAVPPAALLFGAGLDRVRAAGVPRRFGLWLGAGAGACLTAAVLFGASRYGVHHSGLLQDFFLYRPSGWVLALAALVSVSASVWLLQSGRTEESVGAGHLAIPMPHLTAAALGCFFVMTCQLDASLWQQFGTRTPEFLCTAEFAPLVAPQVLIVSSGGICMDPSGHKTANNASQAFYWLDRKGFNTCEGQTTVGQLREFGRRGAGYFVADKASVARQPGLEKALRQAFPLLAECGAGWLFQLSESPGKHWAATASLLAPSAAVPLRMPAW